MDNYLYFIPLLARALQQADSGPALKQAFAEIERLGRQPEYEQGYRQFRRFMVTGARSRPSGEGDVPDLGFIQPVNNLLWVSDSKQGISTWYK